MVKWKKFPILIAVFMVVSVLAVIASAVLHSTESRMGSPLQVRLEEAEFSTDEGVSWKPVGNGSELRKQRGNVFIRGHFDTPIRKGWILNLYMQHMQMEIFVNGNLVSEFARVFHEIRPEWCADVWRNFYLPEISTEDVVEFRMYTLHRLGVEAGAYEKMLTCMPLGEPFFIYQWIGSQKVVEQYSGQILMIIGIVLFCISFVALWMKSPLQKIMMYTALFAIGEGMFWLTDASEIAHYAMGSIAFYSIGRPVSRMLGIYALLACMIGFTSGKAKNGLRIVSYANGVISIVALLLNLMGVVSFCEVEQVLRYAQMLFLLVGLICGFWDTIYTPHSFWSAIRLISSCLACLAIFMEIGNSVFGWYLDVQMTKYVCGATALGQAAALLVQLPASYKAIQRAEMLSAELHNSRIVLAMSQIRTHFIFNVLNAISSLCKSDPEQADRELVRFSRYLRNNIDIMQEDKPVHFEKALEHMHNYVDLEQMRFDEKIMLEEDYEYVDFMIPSLVIQPLVENAIKHGLLPKAEGGVIKIRTCRIGGEVMIEITDNGVGFDTHKKIDKTSVGLSNVRFRMEEMMQGRMQVESTPGVGTTVRLWMPVRKGEASCM